MNIREKKLVGIGILMCLGIVLSVWSTLIRSEGAGDPGTNVLPEVVEKDRTPISGRPEVVIGGGSGERSIVGNMRNFGENGENGVISGRIVTHNGEPVPGARVILRDQPTFEVKNEKVRGGNGKIVDTQVSLASGQFAFTVGRYRFYTLTVIAEDYPPVVAYACHAGQFRELLVQRGGRIEGSVLNAQGLLPCEGAVVRAYSVLDNNVRVRNGRNAGFLAETSTDSMGRFQFHKINSGSVILYTSPAHAMQERRMITVPSGGNVYVDLLVEPGEKVHGVVRDEETGNPIQGASVWHRMRADKRALSDDKGQFQLAGMREGIIVARANGYVDGTAVLAVPIERSDIMVIQMSRGGATEGRVVNQDGIPLSGAAVDVRRRFEKSLRTVWNQLQVVMTGADGRFVINDLGSNGRYSIRVRALGYGTEIMEFPSNRSRRGMWDWGDIQLARECGISGSVENERGSKLGGIPITLYSCEYAGSNVVESNVSRSARDRIVGKCVTDEKGTFRFGELQAGCYIVSVISSPTNISTQTIRIYEEGQFMDDLKLVVETGASISGSVEVPYGELPRRMMVYLRSLDGITAPTTSLVLDQSAETFEFTDVAAGKYVLGVTVTDKESSWLRGRIQPIAAGTVGARIVLIREAWIAGVVRGASGEPLDGISVYGCIAETPGSTSSLVRTDSEGRFRLRVGEGESVDVHAGVALAIPGFPEERVAPPDPNHEVVLQSVPAGSVGVIVELH